MSHNTILPGSIIHYETRLATQTYIAIHGKDYLNLVIFSNGVCTRLDDRYRNSVRDVLWSQQ